MDDFLLHIVSTSVEEGADGLIPVEFTSERKGMDAVIVSIKENVAKLSKLERRRLLKYMVLTYGVSVDHNHELIVCPDCSRLFAANRYEISSGDYDTQCQQCYSAICPDCAPKASHAAYTAGLGSGRIRCRCKHCIRAVREFVAPEGDEGAGLEVPSEARFIRPYVHYDDAIDFDVYARCDGNCSDDCSSCDAGNWAEDSE